MSSDGNSAPFAVTSAEDFRAFVELAPALISYFDADHVCRFANEHHNVWYGRAPEMLIGKHMREFLGEEGYASRRPHLERVARGEAVAFDALVPHSSGGWRDGAVRYFPRMGPSGFEGFYILVFDVARRKQELVEMLDLAHDAILVCNLDRRVTFWNQGCLGLYGLKPAEAVGQQVDALLQTRFPEASEGIMQVLLATGHWEGEVSRRLKDGSDGIVSLRWSMRRNEAGQPVEVLESGRDITDSVKAQHALLKAQADLAHAGRVATLGELTATIAHEVNQPLAAIVTNGEAGLRWLRRDPPELAEARAALGRAVSEGERASAIIARLRNMALKTAPERRWLEVGTVVREALLLVDREASSSDTVLTVDVPDGLPRVLIDRVQLQQVVTNLVLNAVQAMAQANTVDRRVDLSVRAEGSKVCIEVTDTGPGVAAENSPRLFDTFFSTKPTGMGMGLSICRSIVEAHGGAIAMRPNHRGGTVMAFTLPVEASAAPVTDTSV